MKTSLLVDLAGLACLLVSCLATPFPAPMAPSSSRQTTSGGSSKAVTPKEAVKKHVSLIKTVSDTMDNVGMDKIWSLSEAAKLRENDAPVYHSHEVVVSKGSGQGRKGYSNIKYRESIKAVQSHRPQLVDTHAQVKAHIEALRKHKKPEKVDHLLNQAHHMDDSLSKAQIWLNDHVEDPNNQLELLKDVGRVSSRQGYPRPTHDLTHKMNSVRMLLESVPQQHPISKAIDNHPRYRQEAAALVHGAVDKKMAVLKQEEALRLQGHPVVHSHGLKISEQYDNVAYRKAVKEQGLHRIQIHAKLEQAQKHALILSPLNSKKAKEANTMYAALLSAHELLDLPPDDARAKDDLRSLALGEKDVKDLPPTSTKHIDEQRAQAKAVGKMLSREHSLSSLIKGKGKEKA